MRSTIGAAAAPLLAALLPLPAAAEVTVHGNLDGFLAAIVSFTFEGFEAAGMSAGQQGNVPSPLHRNSPDGIFAQGDIAPGVELRNVGAESDFIAMAAGAFRDGIGPAPSVLLFASTDANAIDIVFSPAVTAVALRAFSESDTAGISVFGPGDIPLTAVDIAAPGDTGGFFGVTATSPISRVQLNAPDLLSSGNFEAVDELRFGRALLLFRDGFESGDRAAWSSSLP